MRAARHLVSGPGILLAAVLAAPLAARAQQIDLSHGGPITVTATDSIDLDQKAQTVTAIGNARAVRGTVTVIADRLIAYYRKKQPAPGAPPAASHPPATPVAATTPAPAKDAAQPDTANPDTGNNEIYRLVAEGHVHIYTQTDTAVADHAVYDIDQSVLVLTGHNLKLTSPSDVMTARDSIEWWSQKHMGVGRGDANVTSKDGRRITADVLVAYTTPGNTTPGNPPPAGTAPAKPAAARPPGDDAIAASGKLKQAQAFGNVLIHTQTDIVRGDRGVYDPATGIAVLVGHVRITRGPNQLNGNEAVVDLKTGRSRLVSEPGLRVHGLVMPNSTQTQAPTPGVVKPGVVKPGVVKPGVVKPGVVTAQPGTAGTTR
jgi:lipopolysaccharide export system protein LptA